MAIKEYVIMHGSIKQNGAFILEGGAISMDEKEAALLNLKGETLRLKHVAEAKTKGEKAAAEAEAAALADHHGHKGEAKADHHGHKEKSK